MVFISSKTEMSSTYKVWLSGARHVDWVVQFILACMGFPSHQLFYSDSLLLVTFNSLFLSFIRFILTMYGMIRFLRFPRQFMRIPRSLFRKRISSCPLSFVELLIVPRDEITREVVVMMFKEKFIVKTLEIKNNTKQEDQHLF